MAALRLVPATGAAAVDVTGDSALVGRDPTCDVVVSDGSVSRRHARLERRGETWAVVDQGSANGTFVDSQRIVDSPIRSGQEVRFGAMSYRVEIEGEDETGATIITGGMPEATVIQSEPLIAPRPMAPPARPGGVMPPPLPPRIGSPPPPPPPPPRLGGAPPGPPGPPPGGGYSPPSPVPSMAPPPLPPRKGKSPFFWVGIGCCGCLTLVLVFFGLVGGAAFFATRGAVEAVRAQIAEIKSGNMDAAYSRMSNSYRQSHSAADFGAFAARHPGLKENSDSTFTTRNIQNEKAHLEGYLMAASGARETVTYELTRESGEWKIDDIKFDGESAAAAEAASGPGGGLQIETVDLRKEPSGAGVRVDIKVRVTGFSVKPDGEAYRMDLAEDLETIGPGGQRLPALSRVGLHTLRERTTEATGASAQFVNTLNFASAPVPGSYVARLTIRDHVGQNLTTHEVRFDLP